MSFFKKVQIALDTRLNSLSGSTPIAWENVSYTPTSGTAFIRPTLLMSPSSLMNLNSLQLNQGIYQIDLFYPTENGTGDLLTKMDAIYDHFKNDLDLIVDGVTVYIKEISRSPLTEIEDAWVRGTIEISFKCYNN